MVEIEVGSNEVINNCMQRLVFELASLEISWKS